MIMKKLLLMTFLAGCMSIAAYAQPRPVDKAPTPTVQAGPTEYHVRYEGGIFGSSAKEKGILTFDDENQRVVFYRLKPSRQEMFALPYDSLLVLFPDHQKDVSQTGKVMERMPVPGAGLFGLMSSSAKFAKITFDDPDVEAEGTVAFRFSKKDELLQFIRALGTRADMKPRGDAYYRPRSSPIY